MADDRSTSPPGDPGAEEESSLRSTITESASNPIDLLTRALNLLNPSSSVIDEAKSLIRQAIHQLTYNGQLPVIQTIEPRH